MTHPSRPNIYSHSEYEQHLTEAKTLINDVDDVPFIALVIVINAGGIWTDDAHFFQ